MALQNRVDPQGRIFACADRGMFMGNRGLLHNERRAIVRPYKRLEWITCLLQFKGRRRPLMAPGKYTELFFLDEAVALAAGHRPCFECRRERFEAFKRAWLTSHGESAGRALLVGEVDTELQRFRMDEAQRQVTYQAELGSLPDGCFIQLEGGSYLIWGEGLFLWSSGGYLGRAPRRDGVVTVLTPAPTVGCLRAGYLPEVHLSLSSL